MLGQSFRAPGHACCVHSAATALREGIRSPLVRIMLLPVLAFVVAGLVSTLVWDDAADAALLAWQAVVLWPIGALLLVGPAAMIADLRVPLLRAAGQAILVISGVSATVVVAMTDDAQAGIGYLYAPILGALGAGFIRVADGASRR
jgi:hypothetical protein